VGQADQARVLIVDDNRSFADLLSAALDTVEGVECVGTASSAAECFQRVMELGPSVVVMDIMMPGVDGLAATRELRQLNPGTAVAVVSAYSDGEWIARAEEAGASAYIPKGGSLLEMVEVLAAARPGRMTVAPSAQSEWWASAGPPARPAGEPVPCARRLPARRKRWSLRRGRPRTGADDASERLIAPRLWW
jgi:DNA-binding NarL/FixJ family response regulator